MNRVAMLCVMLFFCSGVRAGNADGHEITTRNVGAKFNEQVIDYSANFGRERVRDEVTNSSADIAFFSYTSENEGEGDRPVVFFSSGGFSNSSAYLHILAFGPKRFAIPDDVALDASRFRTIDNPHSPLDVANLVFYDPPGTGYSRIVGSGNNPFLSAEDDARLMAGFIMSWLTTHNRLNSPIFLFGESYGTIRVTLVAEKLAALKNPPDLSGIMLLGQALNYSITAPRPDNVMGQATLFPMFAVTSWHHRRIYHDGRSFDDFLAEVEMFSRTDYLAALYQGNEISEIEKKRVAERLAEFTGIPSGVYMSNNLRMSVSDFNELLLKSEGRVISSEDSRYSNRVGEEDAFQKVIKEAGIEFIDYIKISFQLGGDPYQFQTAENHGNTWGFEKASPFVAISYTGRLRRVMSLRPDLKLVVVAGYTDTETHFGSSKYAFRQADFLPDRSALRLYEGGHLPYTVESSLKGISNDLRNLVRLSGHD